MRMYKLLTALVALFPLLLLAQVPDTAWTKTYDFWDNHMVDEIQQTLDGGYIIVGNANLFAFLIKIDSSGDTIWTKRYWSGTTGNSVQQTPDSGYVFTGLITGNGNDILLVKTNKFGDTVWTNRYGDANHQTGQSVRQTYDNGYIIAGYTASGSGYYDIFLVKVDSLGVSEWTKTYGGVDYDFGLDVCETTDHGFAVVGYTRSFGAGDFDVWLLRTDIDGDTLWTKLYGGAYYDAGHSIQQTSDDGLIIVGTLFGSYGDVGLIKTDMNGDTSWTKRYGGANQDVGQSVKQTDDGGYIVSGHTYSMGPGTPECPNVYIIRTDSIGNSQWQKIMGRENYHDYGNSVLQTSDRGYLVAGSFAYYPTGEPDSIWLIKLEPDVDVKENPAVTTTKEHDCVGATIFRGFLQLPKDKSCQVFDITGRAVIPDNIKPGIYFIEVNGKITRKIVKVR